VIVFFGVAATVGLVFYVAFSFFERRAGGEHTSRHTRNALQRIVEESQVGSEGEEGSIVRDDVFSSPAMRFLSSLPAGEAITTLVVKSGNGHQASKVILATAILFLILLIVLGRIEMFAGLKAFVIAVVASIYLVYKHLKGRIRKRNAQFLDKFPDVLDMIVRSVKSGFPLNTALKLVAESMEAPVKQEFQLVVDEMAMGRTVDQALSHLAERIDEPDIHFFVVVLNVQQETGGNLAEVITNLSVVIRKRKQLRMKIRAMTSEGRATGLVLGSLPIVIFGVLSYIAPKHLEPLMTTTTGHHILMTAAGMVLLAYWIVRRMIDIDI
jgi:tight adherence protein B